ncbi:UDP-glycosyltransferase 92A1 [Vitis vinifera]|uniref:Glycosyltransferase n=1 Tax=Vitis vinifera TaxID=29760 RepID=A0A438HDN4_VITVI|nr:UDP-glycosyltransferase 92A1 [Vitis vinifera]
MGSQQEHIVMLPFMAQGHIIPFLALAKQVQQRTGFTITIANTPLNIQYLRTTISTTSDDSSRPCIRLAELPFCSSDHGLPPNTENTEALSRQAPLCIISDVFFGWATEVAKSLGTSNVTFTTGGGYGTAAYISLWQNLPHRATDSDYFALPGFPDSCRFHITQLHQYLRAADGTDAWSRYFQPQIALSLDSSGWTSSPSSSAQSFTSSGSSIFGQRAWKVPGVSPEKCLDWLDKHPQSSVLYISFGSQNTISPSQMMELALGLEDSGKPFIWVIRPPVGFDIKGEFRAEWLPENFEQRMAESNQGLIVHKWAPQLEILSHKSTGVFVSHCGWNSVMESLCVGVPIIGWPLAAEQCYNSKMLTEDMGVALELTRGRQGALERKEVKRVIELVMDSKGKGEEMKKKATEIGEKIRDAMREGGSSLKAMDDFVSTMLSKRQGY